MQAIYLRPLTDNFEGLAAYYGDIVLWEPKLLKMYDELLRQIDRALVLYPREGAGATLSPTTASRTPFTATQLNPQHVAFRRCDVLDGVNDGVAPRERARLSLIDLRVLAIHRDLGRPIGEIDAQPVRVAMTRLDAAGRNVDVEDANEGVLVRHLVRVRGNSHRIKRVACRLGQ